MSFISISKKVYRPYSNFLYITISFDRNETFKIDLVNVPQAARVTEHTRVGLFNLAEVLFDVQAADLCASRQLMETSPVYIEFGMTFQELV